MREARPLVDIEILDQRGINLNERLSLAAWGVRDLRQGRGTWLVGVVQLGQRTLRERGQRGLQRGDRGLRRGFAAACLGGGEAVALSLEVIAPKATPAAQTEAAVPA